VKRKKYFDAKRAFQFIWENADSSGLWCGDAVTLAAEFEVSEDAAEDVLNELRAKRLIEKLDTETFIISKWRERDDPAEHLELF